MPWPRSDFPLSSVERCLHAGVTVAPGRSEPAGPRSTFVNLVSGEPPAMIPPAPASSPPFPLDHVGIATRSIEEAAPVFELLTGAPCSPVEELPGQDVNVAFVGRIELLEPRSPVGPVARFIERRGTGLHHVAFRVPDIAAALSRLRAEGLEPVDAEPRPGAGGHLVAFLHPRSAGGVLWELVEG
jgi:methylmalonyl-CoA/ethylmalonyl-CoA epimerase